MAAPRELRIARSQVRLYFWTGLAGLGMAGFLFAAPFLDPEFSWPRAAGIGTLGLAEAAWLLRIASRFARYAVELSDDGVRVPAEGRWAPWSSLSGLSERPLARRVDILDAMGARFASLPYQLEAFSDALEYTVAALRRSPPMQSTFRRSLSTWPAIAPVLAGAGVIYLGLWLWRHDCKEIAVVLVTVFLGAAAYDGMTGIWSVAVGPRDLHLRYGTRRRIVPWDQVTAVRLAARPGGSREGRLDVVVSQVAGPALWVRPAGATPFDLYARLSEELRVWRASNLRTRS
jgi:hypothetical protein